MISSPGELGEDDNEIWDEGNEVEDVKRGAGQVAMPCFFYISEMKNVNKFCDQLPRSWSGCRGGRQSVPFGFAPSSCKCLPPDP